MASNTTKLKHRLFAYGTLKSGQPNNHYLKNNECGTCRFVATGCTELAFPLVIATEWNLPFLLYAPGKGQKVYGEIYDIDDECLKWMDEFEGHPLMYERDRVKVQIISRAADNHLKGAVSESDITECWVYYLKKFEPELLSLETFSSYCAFGKHNRTYIPREDRSDSTNFESALRDECSKTGQR